VLRERCSTDVAVAVVVSWAKVQGATVQRMRGSKPSINTGIGAKDQCEVLVVENY